MTVARVERFREGQATDSATVAAYVGDGTQKVGGSLSITATSTDTAITSSQASGGSFVASGGGAVAEATINPDVQAYAGDAGGGANITVSGTAAINATETPHAYADGFGIQVSLGLAVGVVTSTATVSGNTASYLGANSVVNANGLVVQASQSQDKNSDPTANASATAGAGGILAGANATVRPGFDQRQRAGVHGILGVTLSGGARFPSQANNRDAAIRECHRRGRGWSRLARGQHRDMANSDVATSAALGAGAPASTRASRGRFPSWRSGLDQNDVDVTAGSGGLVASAMRRSAIPTTTRPWARPSVAARSMPIPPPFMP